MIFRPLVIFNVLPSPDEEFKRILRRQGNEQQAIVLIVSSRKSWFKTR